MYTTFKTSDIRTKKMAMAIPIVPKSVRGVVANIPELLLSIFIIR